MFQGWDIAANQMLVRALKVSLRYVMGRSHNTTSNKEVWHKMALLRWDGLMDIGLQLAALKELFPEIPERQEQIISTQEPNDIVSISENVVLDDFGYQA